MGVQQLQVLGHVRLAQSRFAYELPDASLTTAQLARRAGRWVSRVRGTREQPPAPEEERVLRRGANPNSVARTVMGFATLGVSTAYQAYQRGRHEQAQANYMREELRPIVAREASEEE